MFVVRMPERLDFCDPIVACGDELARPVLIPTFA